MPHIQVCRLAVLVLGLTDLVCVQPSLAPDCKSGLGLQAMCPILGLRVKKQWLPET